MTEFLREYSIAENKHKVNDAIFKRSFERPLYQYLVDCCKNLEVLPPITLEGWELITDQTKIHLTLNKRLNKDPKIKNNRALESLIPVNDSVTDMLVLHFKVSTKGQTKRITRRMLVLKPLPGNYYILGGKKVLPINQIVDNSTFVKGDVLKFKTTLFAIDIDTHKINLPFVNGKAIKAPMFRIDLFSKQCNPLLYFLAKYGVDGTLELFNLESVMSIVPRVMNEKKYYYLQITDKLYVEILKEAIPQHEFIIRFLATFYHAIKGASSHSFADLMSTNFWLAELGAVFAKKTVNKGYKVLISFSKIMDPSTAKRLALPKMHKKNSHMLIRWLLTNYTELIKKDNHNLRFKRIRANECIAYYFDAYITRNVNSLLNSDSAPMERYEKLLNAINENTLFKAIRSNKANPYSLFRYESYNCLDAVNQLRWSVKGVSGVVTSSVAA